MTIAGDSYELFKLFWDILSNRRYIGPSGTLQLVTRHKLVSYKWLAIRGGGVLDMSLSGEVRLCPSNPDPV